MRTDALVKWIRGKIAAARAKGCVLGLSGGVDSAVVAALCRKAAGNSALCLIMPCESHPGDVADALEVARVLRLKHKIIDLTPVYKSFLKVLRRRSAPAASNLKPRLRMTALYYYANLKNYLVVGTGNKSELMCGYFTKYGDGGADILPLGSFYKSEVCELARRLGVPDSIIGKPPSAGLWPGQTDEGEMGVTYAEIEDALRFFDKRGRIGNRKVRNMYRRTEHKRKLPEIYTDDKSQIKGERDMVEKSR